jgi:hypothetical protein
MVIFLKKGFYRFLFILLAGTASGLFSQLFVKAPVDRYIHVRNFRYGKDPWVIRCNRGDRLHLTFSSEDTGHSFFLEEFDVDAKVNASSEEVAVFKPHDPSSPPVYTKELVIEANYPGFQQYIISKSNYRCHVWCGPMHAFEQGKLIIMPNTLLFFSMGSILAIILIWLMVFIPGNTSYKGDVPGKVQAEKVMLPGWLKKMLNSRWPQIILMLAALIMITLVITTSLLGTKVSGRNLGVLLMWSVWLFVLITILTPLGGRIWCTICPLPVFGDLIQRGSLFAPIKGKTREYNSHFFGLFRKWPALLDNSWLRLVVFMILATFSTTLVAIPKISGLTILLLVVLPTLMAVIWEHRSFCRYVCPVPAFVVPFSRMSMVKLGNVSQEVCDACKPTYCRNGNSLGWPCPYGINLRNMKDHAECGLCLECMRSCSYDNVTITRRPFCSGKAVTDMSGSWLHIAIFFTAIVYSILYLGPWPQVRDWVNILDKQNWNQFILYALLLWVIVWVILPGMIWLLAYAGKKLSGIFLETNYLFRSYAGALLPLGLMLWMAFVIPMLFVNLTFIRQSLSDPFGWGWDFFHTANIPWRQFLPQYIPWLQAVALLLGLYLSLRNLSFIQVDKPITSKERFLLCLPHALFMLAITTVMILFFTD